MFESKVLRRIFGPKRDEVTGEWRKLHNEELNDLYLESKEAFRATQQRTLVSAVLWLGVSVLSRPSSGHHFPVEGTVGVHYTLWDPILCTGCSSKQITTSIRVIKVLLPTDAQENRFKRCIKIYIKTAPTCFGVITNIRERTI